MIIWLQLRHIKAYKWIKFIPIWEKYNFINYFWENGVWKSSILQSFDFFLNNKTWAINKSANLDWIWGDNLPFIAPIFLINKRIEKEDWKIENRVKKQKKVFETISDFFWELKQKSAKNEFFSIRNNLVSKWINKESHYLIFLWEFSDDKLYIPTLFQGIDQDFKNVINDVDEDFYEKWYKDFLKELKSLYSYVYIPVENDIEDFTKMETKEMGKIFNREIKDDIWRLLKQKIVDDINAKLNLLVESLEKAFDEEYFYDTWNVSKKFLTKPDLVNKILEVYFQKRVLNKWNKWQVKLSKKISELSSWEKRQALINLIYAFLKQGSQRDKILIIWIDEPENSLHTSLCFEQFEKLKEISENNQIFITTHWYWFLPIVSKWFWHFLNIWEKDKIEFDTYDLYDYRSKIKNDIKKSENQIPKDFWLKSINDLVQSIFYSIRKNEPYNWIICEWISDKIYLEYFFEEEIKNNNLKILPVWWKDKVIEIFEYIKLPIKKEKSDKNIKGKVFCLTDTDSEIVPINLDNWIKDIILLKRLCNNKDKKTDLLEYSKTDSWETEIENSLIPKIFLETIKNFEQDLENLWISISDFDIEWTLNTDFNFWLQLKAKKQIKMKEFFDLNNWGMKVNFANKYIESSKENSDSWMPNWNQEIKDFFN